jgi:hypothetical protein
VSGPKLRTVEKVRPPYPLNKFPTAFPFEVAAEVVYRVCTETTPSLEGPAWEQIFAKAIKAKWTPSNVGLDDVQLGVCAWGVKSLKNSNPFRAGTVRLISGRNNPEFSFGTIAATDDGIGKQVLQIWNGRVESIRSKFSHLRTVVFVKAADLMKFTVFEMDTVMYLPETFEWRRNRNSNLEGFEKDSGFHKFTWQRHGSQFTILEAVPDEKLCFKVKKPKKLPMSDVLKTIGFDPSWVEIVKP